MKQHSCTVINAESDADVVVVDQALKSAQSNVTVVVADDTDILILLCSQATSDLKPIYQQPLLQSKQYKGNDLSVFHIKHTQRSLGELTQILPLIHAVTGCDTTSRVYGLGKRGGLQKFMKSKMLQAKAKTFLRKGEHKSKIIQDGEAILLELCRATQCHQNNLDRLRFDIFSSKVANAQINPVKPHELPPTSSAAKYHSLRVYHQVQTWCGEFLVAHDWGWFLKEGYLLPILMEKNPALP